jgi:hypothetical protein
VERMNRTLKDILLKLVNEKQNEWDIWIPQALLAYRSTKHSSTRFSPFTLMFGREARIPVSLVSESARIIPNPPEEEHLVQSEYVGNMKKRFQETYEITRRNTKEAGQR